MLQARALCRLFLFLGFPAIALGSDVWPQRLPATEVASPGTQDASHNVDATTANAGIVDGAEGTCFADTQHVGALPCEAGSYGGRTLLQLQSNINTAMLQHSNEPSGSDHAERVVSDSIAAADATDGPAEQHNRPHGSSSAAMAATAMPASATLGMVAGEGRVEQHPLPPVVSRQPHMASMANAAAVAAARPPAEAHEVTQGHAAQHPVPPPLSDRPHMGLMAGAAAVVAARPPDEAHEVTQGHAAQHPVPPPLSDRPHMGLMAGAAAVVAARPPDEAHEVTQGHAAQHPVPPPLSDRPHMGSMAGAAAVVAAPLAAVALEVKQLHQGGRTERRIMDAGSIVAIVVNVVIVLLLIGGLFLACGKIEDSQEDGNTNMFLGRRQFGSNARDITLQRGRDPGKGQRLDAREWWAGQQVPSPMPSSRNLQMQRPPSSSGDGASRSQSQTPSHPKAGLRMPPSPAMTSPDLDGAVRHLCPGLVVPLGSECLLALPLPKVDGMRSRDRVVFDVKDLQGKPVIGCELSRPDWSSRARAQTIAVLRAASPSPSDRQYGQILAQCEAASDDDDRCSTHVYDGSGELYAQITRDPYRKCYTLTVGSGRSGPGPQMVFDGDFENYMVLVTSELRERLADTEPFTASFDPHTPHIKLRVVSGVDVGTVLCGLLSADLMETR